jgi:hypothetical protein
MRGYDDMKHIVDSVGKATASPPVNPAPPTAAKKTK